MIRFLAFGIAWLLLSAGMASAGWFRVVEVTSEPEREGQKDYTVRFTPARTHACDKVVLECTLSQQIPWVDEKGKPCLKINEPIAFIHRRTSVKFVNDLDVYISFRVPIGMDRLKQMYGPKTFAKDQPVTVSRIKATGLVNEEAIWSFEVEADGKHARPDSDAEEATELEP